MKTSYMMPAVYVGDLHLSVTEAMLLERFSPAGPIHSIRLCRDRKTGSSLGYAYINFKHQADVERAVDMFNFELLMEQPMRVMKYQKDPSERKNGIGNLFIKNLDKSIDSMALFDTFSVFGKVLSCKVVGYETGSKCYGYVQYESVEAAEMAIEKLNGKLLNDRQVFIERFKNREERKAEASPRSKLYTNIYVKNLSKDVNDQLLKDIFSKFGPTQNAQVITDENGDSKGFGFVKFERHEDAQRAVDEMNRKKLNGKQMYVGGAQTKQERQTELNKEVNCPMWGRKSEENYAAVDSVPAVDIVPAMDSVPTVDPLPAMDSVPTVDPLPAMDSVWTEKSAPVIKPAPHVDSYPVGGLSDDVRPAASQAQAVSELQQDKATADGPTSPPVRKQLTIYKLESVPVDDQIQMAYDYTLPLVEELHPTMAKKITWMLLEGENNFNIINLIRDPELLHARVNEMDSILKAREAGHKPETLKMLYNNNSNKKRVKKNRRKNQ